MIDPRGCRDVMDWADSITIPLAAIGVTPRRLDNPGEWMFWAFNLMQSIHLQKYLSPDPRGYDTWQEWAEQFNLAVPY